MTRPFEDLAVLELLGNQLGATVGQFFADYGADVVMVEPPGGSPLREEAAFPFWARGKRSVVLDAKDTADRAVLLDLARRADVLIETFRPGVAARLGLDYEALCGDNPGLVYVSVTGFGVNGPYAGVRGYEAVVQAKVGAFHQSAGMAGRPGPAFVASPYCSASAAQVGIHAVLAGLIERLRSGRGQHVQTSMAQALAAHDTWNWMVAHVAKQYPEAFQSVPPVDEDGVPTAGILFRLMTGISADGRWLQFSQTAQRLFEAFMRAVDLGWMLSDPEWKTAPEFDDAKQRREFWELLLTRIQGKTVAEWNKIFDADPDVWAEVLRKGPEVFEHPQLVYDGNVVEIPDPERGPVRQFAPLVRINGEAEPDLRPAPAVPESSQDIGWATADSSRPIDSAPTPDTLPLAGIVVLELGTQYAAPFGATLLTDLGARVIKIEQQDGDQIRWMTPFPDLSGVKVLQGKESLAINITRPEGLAVVHELVRRADVVLQSFRAGVAKRRGLDASTLQTLNPNLIYVSAPAYGESGPCGHRPAYAPTIGAACGIAWRNVGAQLEEGPGLDLDVVKAVSMRVRAGILGPAHPDGFSALGVGTALLFGIYLREKGQGARHLTSSMLLTTGHAMADGIVDYPGRPESPAADRDLYGFNARYRLYQAASGWVLLAAPTDGEWPALTAALDEFVPLSTDPRFATPELRVANDAALAEQLSLLFLTQSAQDWEDLLLPRDVTCVRVTEEVAHEYMYSEEFGRASGYVTDVVHPVFGEHPRLVPFLDFSRSATQTGVGCRLGQHTDSILAELGYSAEQINDLRQEGVVS
jgi:crotonobetainyl-CoA:carnitine CoA-transferase CaiB-like acyl-CoA transferase